MQTVAMRKNLHEKTIETKVAKQKLTEKAARAEQAARVWDKHPLFEGTLSKIKDAKKRQNEAINLTNQARFMRQLNEQETSAEFQRMAPANMMRLVQLVMFNLNRGNVFSEYSMETARDAIYYIKQNFSRSIAQGAGNFAERSMSYDAAKGKDQDPYGFDNGIVNPNDEYGVGGYNGNNPAYGGKKRANNGATNTNARKSVYESKESRFANELANAQYIDLGSGSGENGGTKITISWKGNFFGENGELYVPGSTKIYVGRDERELIAFQDPNTLEYLVAQEFAGAVVTESPRAAGDGVVETVIDLSGVKNAEALAAISEKGVNAYARFESEIDYDGITLGEVNLLMNVYELRPHRTSIGVSWTKLTEVTLDSTFDTQVDDLLLTTAANVIQQQLDLQAFKEAYAVARTNPEIYKVDFDAGYATNYKDAEGKNIQNVGTKDSYNQIAQTLSSAIEIAGAALYSDIHRGAINKLVVGISVAPYLKLNLGFEAKGLQSPVGVYKIGELDGIDVYKAPIEVIPDNEILCVYKNADVENDVAVVFGTLVPFVSNKLEYPTLYTRAGLASYGDRAWLNPKYLARIVVKNLKDRINAAAYMQMALGE